MARNKSPDFEAMARKIKKDAVRYASIKGVNFIQDNFHKQGFTNKAFEPWVKRKGDVDPGRKILVKSAYLLNSIRVFQANQERIVFGSDAAYSEIHNEGGTITVRITSKARRYFWFMYKKTGQERWKWMALSRKDTMRITIPKRQFMGHSDTLMERLDEWLVNHIVKQFKQA